MIKNYIKIALRNIIRQKGYSFINIFGLATGIASCILILVWVHNELSYDGFNKNAGRICRLYGDLTMAGNLRSQPVVGAPVAPALEQALPEIESTVRMTPFKTITAKYGEKEFREDNIYYAENSIFDVFTFPFISGDPATALTTRYSIVLTEKVANKYFGKENPLGKSLRFSNGRLHTVTGVMKDVPQNSHFTFDMLCSYETWIIWNEQAANSWGWMEQTTYLLTAPGVDFKTLEKKIEPVVHENLGAKIKQVGATFRIGLQPLTKIHLFSNFEDEMAKTGSIMYVYLFSGVALFILLIACINFINLSTARYSNRALEVGLRKTLGASRNSLVRQFLGETMIVTFFAVALGYLLALVLLPLLKALTGQELSYGLLVQPWFLLLLILSVVCIGVLAGAYPAIFLSSFEPVKTLKGHLKIGAASSVLRRILVVGQFSISIALIAGTLIIYDQLQFVRNKQLGFNKDQVLTLPYPNNSQNWTVGSLRQELAAIPGVMNIGFTSNVPGTGPDIRNFRPEGRTEDESILMEQLYIEPNLLLTLGIEIIKGRNFSETIQTDPSEAVLINETTAKQLGWDDPIGKSIFISGRGQDGKPIDFRKNIVGVVRDFHTRSLHNKIEPLTIFHNKSGFSVIAIKLAGGAISETISKLRNKWEVLFPDQPFSYSFLDESFDNMYKSEEQMNKIFTSFSFIAIIISCLGLFGLAAYMTEKRTKEVGIRKVMGASVSGILYLLSKELTKWVLVANIIAWPVAYYFMNGWLQTFAYHVDLNVWIFIFSGFTALLIAWITVSYQSMRIARSNPVKSLRYE